MQKKVAKWVKACIGSDDADSRDERNQRFFEEACELVQSAGMTRYQAEQVLKYSFSRPAGIIQQEAAGVQLTLYALVNAWGISLKQATRIELARAWDQIDRIREKHKNKPRFDRCGCVNIGACDGSCSPDGACDAQN